MVGEREATKPKVFRWMAAWSVIIALMLVSTCLGCGAKQQTFSHEVLAALADTSYEDEKWPIPQPAVADSAWAYVKECLGFIGVDTAQASLSNIRWYETKAWERYRDNISSDGNPDNDVVALGNWVMMDDDVVEITLARRARRPDGSFYMWAVAHELAHHLLIGPVREHPFDTGHPFVPFAYPCKLMAWQHLGEWDRRPNLDEDPQ